MRKLVGMTGLLCAAVCVAGAVGAQDAKTPAGQKADAKLEGTYTIVSGEENGKEVPADKVKGSVVLFTGDTITGTDKDKKEFFAAKYTLDTGKTPWAIKMRSTAPKEADAVGLVKKDGDTITLIYALPGGAAPTEFKTKDRQNMFVLKSTEKGK